MNQQLAKVPLPGRRHPQPGKPILHQQPQDVARIATVGLLPPHIAGPDLRRIPNPHLMAQPLQQVEEPLAVAARLHTHQRWNLQSTIKPLRFSIAVDQLVF